MDIHFEYKLDDMVTTCLGESGIVTMLGYDEGGIQYAVKTVNGVTWYKESQLTTNVS